MRENERRMLEKIVSKSKSRKESFLKISIEIEKKWKK